MLRMMTRITLSRPDVTLVGTDVGSGPPALLLHAGGERRTVWDPVSEDLAERGLRGVAFDQRGHGESVPARRGGGLPMFAEDVVAMIAGLERPLVVGSSLGGLAALWALADRAVEAQVAGLVLVDVVPDPDHERTAAFLTATIGGRRAGNPLVEDILGRGAALRQLASELSLPTLLVRGGGHSPLTDADVQRFISTMPHADIEVIPGAGHLVARDAPLELAALIASRMVVG